MHGHFATDLGDLDDRYELLDRFGQGMCGSVLQARRRSTGELVAIKMLVYEDDCADGVPAHIIREVCLLRDFTHPNVVQLLEVQVVGAAQYNLVFEHVDHDLHRELKAYRAEDRLVPLRTLLEYSRGLLQGVQACHLRQVVHRNLKPQNILVAEEGLKICDFGLARLFEPTHRAYTGSVVSLWYRAPEILLGSAEYGKEVDLWSAGCCVSEMATCYPLFPGKSEIETVFSIFRLLGTPTELTWPGLADLAHWQPVFPQWPPTRLEIIQDARDDLAHGTAVGDSFMDLLRGLLCINPAERLPARKASRHEVFNELGQ